MGLDDDIAVGIDVGWHRGPGSPPIAVGIDVGLDVGLAVGIDVGIAVGLDVGLDDGIDVGLDDGIAVGLDVGLDENERRHTRAEPALTTTWDGRRRIAKAREGLA